MAWHGQAQAWRADNRTEQAVDAVMDWLRKHPRWVGTASELSYKLSLGGSLYPYMLGALKMLVDVGALTRQGRNGPFVVIDPSKL